jgi:HD-like signal output (HDOD) protein
MTTAQVLFVPIDEIDGTDETDRPPPLSVRRVLHSEAVRRIVSKLDRLPSAPRTYWALANAAAKPESSLADIARIVQNDPAMSAKVLQLVNSAYFGISQRISSVPHAVSYLGTALLKGLALTTHVFATMEGKRTPGFSLEEFQAHSVGTGQLARRFLTDPKRAEIALTAALVHDIGKVVMALSVPAQFSAAARRARQSGVPAYKVEREMIGITHAEVGGYLLSAWGLPFTVVEAVAYHHDPGAVTEGPYDVLAAVHVAEGLLDGAVDAYGPPSRTPLDMGFLERTGFVAELPRWRAAAADIGH